jgi:hypothetical protein
MVKHDNPNPESILLRRKAEELLKIMKAETLNISRPYGTLGDRVAYYSTNIQSRWDCPAIFFCESE